MERNILSPLDGRYRAKAACAAQIMGEHALTQNRVRTEIEYFKALGALGLKEFKKLSAKEISFLDALLPLSAADLQVVNDIEFKGYKNLKPTNHDVKAVEYFLQDKFAAMSLKDRVQWLHFALTSEDVNSVSYAMILRDGVELVLLPALNNILKQLDVMSKKYANAALLARTHGQAAVPTTFGKEFRVFEYRLRRQVEALGRAEVSCKFSGAVGNFNAHKAVYDKIDWLKFAKKFVSSLNKGRKIKIFLQEVSAQADAHDSYAEIFDNIRRINTILLDFSQDMWRYISDGLVKQRTVAGEVGSSTMPQKVNPIDFENAEGNLGLANAMLVFFSAKLPVSRLQRDLSDSTVLRNAGVAFGYCTVAYSSLLKGMGKIEVNKDACQKMLAAHPEVLAEGVQTILRAAGVKNAYELLKDFTRGSKIDAGSMKEFIAGLKTDKETKNKLNRLTVQSYTGIAQTLAKGRKRGAK